MTQFSDIPPDHEPDGANDQWAIEKRYGVPYGGDWFEVYMQNTSPLYWKRKLLTAQQDRLRAEHERNLLKEAVTQQAEELARLRAELEAEKAKRITRQPATVRPHHTLFSLPAEITTGGGKITGTLELNIVPTHQNGTRPLPAVVTQTPIATIPEIIADEIAQENEAVAEIAQRIGSGVLLFLDNRSGVRRGSA